MTSLALEKQNIMNWYPFNEDASILIFGKKDINMIEMLSERASEVNQAEALKELQEQKEYDYIILNNELKNARRYVADEEYPYATFLREMIKFLKPEGHILLAMQNRLGLRYFAGVPEEGSKMYFEGINHYPRHQATKTFSRSEIIDLLEQVGLSGQEFYYPYPDCTYPNEIFTSKTLSVNGYGRSYNNFQRGSVELFQEDKVAKDLIREGTIESHVNAFLIDATIQATASLEKVIYAKINSDRSEEFRIVTKIIERDGEKVVQKLAASEAAIPHLKKMYDYETSHTSGKYQCLSGTWVQSGVEYPFITEQSLDSQVEQWIAQDEVEEIVAQMKDVIDHVYPQTTAIGEELYTKAFVKCFGNEKADKPLACVKPANIDLILGNIFKTNDRYQVIDCEWIMNFDIPKDFIIWRSVNEIIYGHPAVLDKISELDLYAKFNISEQEVLLYRAWNKYFTEEYVQANQLRLQALPRKTISLARDLEEKLAIDANLYVDYGNGYAEDAKLNSYQLLEADKFQCTYLVNHPEKVQQLRWDPVEGKICRCKGYIINQVIGKQVALNPVNAYTQMEEWDEFDTTDPQYDIPVEAIQEKTITITGRIQYLSNEEIAEQYIKPRTKLEKIAKKLSKK